MGKLSEHADGTLGVVVTLGNEVWKSSWNGYRQIIKVWPYADPAAGGFEKIEQLAEQLISKLDEAVIGRMEKGSTGNEETSSSLFTCFYLGSSDSDRVDSITGRCTRGLRFAAYRHPPHAKSSSSGFGLEALSKWTQEMLGTKWHVYQERWPTDCQKPSVLWRLSASRNSNSGTAAFDVQHTYTGHIWGVGISEERQAIQLMVNRLSIQPSIRYNEPERLDWKIADVVSDLQADRFLKGQITLIVTERIRRSEQNVTMIGRVENKPFLS